jgi:hypothetical protein
MCPAGTVWVTSGCVMISTASRGIPPDTFDQCSQTLPFMFRCQARAKVAIFAILQWKKCCADCCHSLSPNLQTSVDHSRTTWSMGKADDHLVFQIDLPISTGDRSCANH